MAGPQHAQCCCTPPDNPDCVFPCLELTIAGMESVLCGCGFAPLYNTTFTLAQTTEATWYTNTCPVLDKRYCGFYAVSVTVVEEGDGWHVYATLIGEGIQIVWTAGPYETEPDCTTWDEEELTYSAALSVLDDGFDNPQVDPSGSSVTLTALPEDAECDQGTACPADEAPCSSPGFGVVGVDDMCNNPAFIPSQLRVTLPPGNWVDRSTITEPGGGVANVACNDTGQCPTGDFILDYDGGCAGVWSYLPTAGGNCTLSSIFAYLQRGTGINPFPNLTDPADPELRLVVKVNWTEQFPTSFPGTIPTGGSNYFTLCVDDSCEPGQQFDCWMGLEEFEMGYHYCSGNIACVWEGLNNFNSDTPPRFCTKPDSSVPITAQFLP